MLYAIRGPRRMLSIRPTERVSLRAALGEGHSAAYAELTGVDTVTVQQADPGRLDFSQLN